MKKFKYILTVFFVLFAAYGFARDDVDYFKERDIIKDLITQSLQEYKAGNADKARALASTAYFQHFENMEGPIGRNIGKRGFFMERKFTNLRAYYGQKQPVKKIQALIDGIFFDLDEVTPIIQNGFKIRAVASEINYDKQKAIASARSYQFKQCVDAQMMFGSSQEQAQAECKKQASDEESRVAAEEAGTVQKDYAHNQSNVQQDNISSLQAAAQVDPKLQYLYDLISEKFDEAIALNKEKDYAAAADAIAFARTDLYVNTKLEIAINSVKNINLRVRLRNFGSLVRSGELSEHDMRAKSEEILDEIFDYMQKIDASSEYYAQIDAPGYVAKASGKDYAEVASQIRASLDGLLNQYTKVATANSIEELQSIYLDVFEASGMEDKIGAVDVSTKLAIEAKFSQAKALMQADASTAEIKDCIDELNALIAKILPKITDNSSAALFITALGIIIREGLEALIIVVAIVSYIIQTGNKDRLKIAYSALWTGVLLSFVTAFAVTYFISNSGQSRELIEGITMLIAVVLLLYVGFWLLSNSHNKAYAQGIMQSARTAISSGSAKTLWWTVFLAVFREGAETILFYQALLIDGRNSNSGISPVLGGLALGLVVLVVLYYLLKAGAIRIPIKWFFRITSYIIFYMVFVFTGKGIMELVEGKIFTPTILLNKAGKPLFEAQTSLGLHPYLESLIPQAIILLLLIVGVLYMQFKSKKETK